MQGWVTGCLAEQLPMLPDMHRTQQPVEQRLHPSEHRSRSEQPIRPFQLSHKPLTTHRSIPVDLWFRETRVPFNYRLVEHQSRLQQLAFPAT